MLPEQKIHKEKLTSTVKTKDTTAVAAILGTHGVESHRNFSRQMLEWGSLGLLGIGANSGGEKRKSR